MVAAKRGTLSLPEAVPLQATADLAVAALSR
jgi:hypothetical protein